jgi:hypothetical protein
MLMTLSSSELKLHPHVISITAAAVKAAAILLYMLILIGPFNNFGTENKNG